MSRTFYVLDFDRTLFDTIRGASLMADVVFEYDEKLGRDLRVHTDELLRSKTTFSIYDFIRDAAGEEAANRISRAFVERAVGQDLLLEGTRELLAFVRDRGARAGILTFGSPEGQALKIAAAGLNDIPHVITDDASKGAAISRWYQAEKGLFELPPEFGGEAEEVVLVDDKQFSFVGLPARQARGYWIRTAIDVSAPEPTEANIRTVTSLGEVMSFEREFDKTISTV